MFKLKYILPVLFLLLFPLCVFCQISTFKKDWTYGDNMKVRLHSIELDPSNSRAYVTLEMQATAKMKRLVVWYSDYAMLKISSWMQLLGASSNGSIIDVSSSEGCGWKNPVVGDNYHVKLVFSGDIYPGANLATLSGKGTLTFKNVKINNPMKYTTSLKSESEIKQNIQNSEDPLCGIYEEVGKLNLKLALVRDNNEYKLVFMNWKPGDVTFGYIWKIGDVAALNIRPTVTGIAKCDWLIPNQRDPEEAYIGFDNGKMSMIFDGGFERTFLKTYPLNNNATSNGNSVRSGETWTGTGFALLDRYIATNYHVVEGANKIQLYGVDGDFGVAYSAKVVATDKTNDLAVIRIEDGCFSGFGKIPYSVNTTISDVGEDVFVLGYPMTSTMGDEIKLTTGVISSRTGFQGNVVLYQISAPIQPGNSGGPIFDNRGNVIGIVSAKHKDAENVGYAIKASYLKNLIESSLSLNLLPQNNNLTEKSLTGKVKALKNYIYLIKCEK